MSQVLPSSSLSTLNDLIRSLASSIDSCDDFSLTLRSLAVSSIRKRKHETKTKNVNDTNEGWELKIK